MSHDDDDSKVVPLRRPIPTPDFSYLAPMYDVTDEYPGAILDAIPREGLTDIIVIAVHESGEETRCTVLTSQMELDVVAGLIAYALDRCSADDELDDE